MGRLERIEQTVVKLEEKENEEKDKKKKPFKFPIAVRGLFKRAQKSDKHILIFYLTQKYQLRIKLCPIVSGNLVVVNNKVHKLNPRMIWRYGKFSVYIIKEIDRTPVSNEDYDDVKKRGEDTESDVPLIKAVMGAVQKSSTLEKRNMWIIIILIAVAVGAFLIFF